MDEKKKFSGLEMNAFLHLQAAWCAMEKAEPLTERIKGINAYGMFRGADGMIKKIIDRLADTMPAHQRDAHTRNCRTLEYGCFVKRPSKINPDDGLWLSYAAANQIVGAAKEYCLTCTKNPQEMRSCKLHKALDELPLIHEDCNNRNCPYFGGI